MTDLHSKENKKKRKSVPFDKLFDEPQDSDIKDSKDFSKSENAPQAIDKEAESVIKELSEKEQSRKAASK